MKKPVIALMCKSHDYKTTSDSSAYITSAWTMSKKKAFSLVGQNVILTEGRKQPAYLGGKVTGVTKSKTDSSRWDVWFTPSPSLKGNTDSVDHPGWGSGRAVCYL